LFSGNIADSKGQDMAGLAISRVQKKRNLEFSKILAGNEAFGRSNMSVKKQSLSQKKSSVWFCVD
jgi:hypothetical protein